MDRQFATAVSRFGLGGRPDETRSGDPQAWLRAQLAGPDAAAASGPATAHGLALVRDAYFGANIGDAKPIFLGLASEAHRLLLNATTTQAPFRERLVWFWTNHFTIAAGNLVTTACAGAYIREAIRPHVTGRFADMLMAVMRHPAMLAYLDQTWSAGPDSIAGRRRGVGLNENLARECLELHTIGAAAGYTQADVTSFAKILTGWSFEFHDPPTGFVFRPNLHQPGEQTVMGRAWPEGQAGGEQFLAWLAGHPATHRRLASKLVQHFVADEPPEPAVRAIEGVLRDTQGDLGAASAAVAGLDGAWVPLTKLRTPQDYVVAVLRAACAPPDLFPFLGNIVARLGQPVLHAPSPQGWPDRADAWANPAAIVDRSDFACNVAARIQGHDAGEIAGVLGPLLSPLTRKQMEQAGTRQEAIALFLASPEMQRR